MTSATRTFAPGDRVTCYADGKRLSGVVLHVFRNGRVLVDVGTGKSNKHGDPDRDARVFEKVERA